MKQRTRYRVRAVWKDGTWIVGSPDVDVLLLHAQRFDEVAPVARNAIARFVGVHSSTIDIAVQPVSLADPQLQWFVEQALVAQETAKAMAQQAANRTFEAVDALEVSGMDMRDIEQLVGLAKKSEYQRRMGRFGIRSLDDDPWLRDDEEDDWNPVNPWDRWHWSENDPSFPARMLKALADEVGGAPELAVIDCDPLPDEEFAWDGIDDDIRARVAEVLRLCDAACDALFDVEARTACQRLLARVARRSPKLFRQKGGVASAAGAVCWIIGKANHLFDTTAPPRIKDLGEAIGVTTPGTRGDVFLKAAGLQQEWHNRVVVGSADLLVSAHRLRIIELRDDYSDRDFGYPECDS